MDVQPRGAGVTPCSTCAMKDRSVHVSGRPISTIRANVFHVFYGVMFTPPNLEAISFAKLNTAGTKAQPEDTTNNTVRAERAHYFEVGSYHALNRYATLQFTGWYKLSNYLLRCRAVRHHAVVELFCLRARLAARHRRRLETANEWKISRRAAMWPGGNVRGTGCSPAISS